MEQIRIPARTLGLLNLSDFCPGCFWIRLHCEEKFPFQIPMPGIFSSIDSYVKRIIHAVFDQDKRLPTWFPNLGSVKCYVQTLHYSWFKCEDRETRIILTGTPDDVFQLADGSYHIPDYKTAKVTEKQDELFPLYEVQLNAYAYMAERLTKRAPLSPVSAVSLIYLEPQTDMDPDRLVDFASHEGPVMRFKAILRPVELRPNEAIPPLLSRARDILDRDQAPEHIGNCKDLNLLNQLLKIVQIRGDNP